MWVRLWFVLFLTIILPFRALGAEDFFVKEEKRTPPEMGAYPVCVVSRAEDDEIAYYLDSRTEAVKPCRFGGSRGLVYFGIIQNINPDKSKPSLEFLVWQGLVFVPYETLPVYPGMYAIKSQPPARPIPTKKWYWEYNDGLGVWCRIQKDIGKSVECFPEKHSTK